VRNEWVVEEASAGGRKADARFRDASQIVRTITSAVKYLHDQGIVHRGTFLLFRILETLISDLTTQT
jgi:hypothetical protein